MPNTSPLPPVQYVSRGGFVILPRLPCGVQRVALWVPLLVSRLTNTNLARPDFRIVGMESGVIRPRSLNM